MVADELRDQIREAFPATPFYGPITSCDCEECVDIREGLRYKQWDQVSEAFLDFTCSPVLLTPEAFHAFLPAYLLRGLDDLTGRTVVLEFTVYSLCPDDDEEEDEYDQERHRQYLRERAILMSPHRLRRSGHSTVCAGKGLAETGEWLQPFVTRGLEGVWR